MHTNHTVETLYKLIMDKYDVMNFNESDYPESARFGIPEDEYDIEAQEIIKRLPECKTVEDVTKMVEVVFAEMFGPEHVAHFNNWSELAREIVA